MSIPKFEGIEKVNSPHADNADIRRAIFASVPKANKQMAEMALRFKGKTHKETCRNIFDFLKNNLKYKADGEVQTIQLPSALLKHKKGDCKSYSVFTSAVLTNLHIPHHFVLASYADDPTPGHIYVKTKSGCIIDAVYGKFDQEKKANYLYEVETNGQMIVKTISGIKGCGCGCGGNCGVNGIFDFLKRSPEKKAAAEQKKQERKDNRAQGAFSKVKTVGLAGGRNMFLIIVTNNLDGFASKLRNVNQAQLKSSWLKVGGSWNALDKAIKNGATKKPKSIGLIKALRAIGITGHPGIGSAGSDAGIVAACAAAGAAVGTAIPGVGNAVGGTWGAAMGAVLVAMKAILPSVTRQQSSDGEQFNPNDNLNPPPSEDSNTAYYLMGGAAVLAAYLMTKK
jgi:hypothetical protein